jgi:hypothetical protein
MENIPYPGHKCSEGRERVEDEPRVGRPSTSKTDDNVERVRSGGRPQGICATRTNSQSNFLSESP